MKATLDHSVLSKLVAMALEEDLGSGDHSSKAAIPEKAESEAILLMKNNGIVAGITIAEEVLRQVDNKLALKAYFKDGDEVKQGDVIFQVQGRAQSILMAERTLLNFMQRLSGIATYTSKLVEMTAHTRVQILDTRKTTPALRMLEKWAVRLGGGTNHRFGLYDMIMLKDNHIDYAGGMAAAIRSARQYLKDSHLELQIEVETRNLNEVEEVLQAGGVHIIMLDNMSPSLIREAVKLIDGRFKTEASGGITEENLVEMAETGVDFISVGALTHSARSLDMSLKAKI